MRQTGCYHPLMDRNGNAANPTGYSQKSKDGLAETTCPNCGASQVEQHPVTGEWTCLYCRTKWAATETPVVAVNDENAPRGADIADGRVFACPNCGGLELKQNSYTGKWMCLDCRNEFLDVDARMVVVNVRDAVRKNDLVIDTANLMSDGEEAKLLATLRGIASKMVVAVETVNTITENIEYFARRRAQALGVGRADIDNGVYIVVVKNPRRIQIVTGNGVAKRVSAGDLNRISSELIAPKFKKGAFVAGLTAGALEILRLYEAEPVPRFRRLRMWLMRYKKQVLGWVSVAAVLLGGGYWLLTKPYHSYTHLTAKASACVDHYYVYDKATKTHVLASKTVVLDELCIAERRTESSCSSETYTTYRSVDWQDIAISSRTVTGDFCSSDDSSSSSGNSSSFGGGSFDSGSSGGSDW